MDIYLVIAIIFAAFLIRSTFGFGDALFGMPLLVMVTGIQTAAPLMALLAILMALLILLKNRQSVNFQISWKLIISAILGVPVGLIYLAEIDVRIINLILGFFIIIFAIMRLTRFAPKKEAPPALSYVVGFISGILGGAYNTNGPPVIMLLSAQNWPAAKFRSTLQNYFFFTGLGIVGGHIAWGNVTAEVISYSLYGLPAMVLAWWLGERVFSTFKTKRFYNWVYLLLIVIGLGLISKVISGIFL